MKTLSLFLSAAAFACIVACGGPSDRSDTADTVGNYNNNTDMMGTDTLADTSINMIDTSVVVPVP